MKIAISGKGGVGKTTIAAIFCHLAAEEGYNVLAIDADPDANLAFALGIPEYEIAKIIPISQQQELIEERTGAKLKQFGQIFRLNPTVSDIADKCGYNFGRIKLLVLGAVEKGGSGCACPENVFLKNLLLEIILSREDFVICDFEAGVEHLGRGTAKGVDLMLIVVEPTHQSIGTALSIQQYCRDVGILQVRYIGNKVHSAEEKSFIENYLEKENALGYIPALDDIRILERKNISSFAGLSKEKLELFRTIYNRILVEL